MTTMTTVPTMPVRYSAHADRLYFACDEFGEFAAILAKSFDDAYDEALAVMADRDGECDHGADPDVGPDGEGCDCDATDDGRRVWAVYLTLRPTRLPLAMFELAHGADAEVIAR